MISHWEVIYCFHNKYYIPMIKKLWYRICCLRLLRTFKCGTKIHNKINNGNKNVYIKLNN